MSAVLFAPHGDDETLFAFYQCLRRQPYVIVVFRSFRQWTQQNGPIYTTRERETDRAMEIAGCRWEQWSHPDTEQNAVPVAIDIAAFLAEHEPEVVIYPAWELGGHEDHNLIASIVGGVEGPWEHIRYVTYRRGHGRTVTPNLIEGTEKERELKLEALACYESQVRHPATLDWFPGGRHHTTNEWLA